MPLHVGAEKPAPFGRVFILFEEVGKLNHFDRCHKEAVFGFGWKRLSIRVVFEGPWMMDHKPHLGKDQSCDGCADPENWHAHVAVFEIFLFNPSVARIDHLLLLFERKMGLDPRIDEATTELHKLPNPAAIEKIMLFLGLCVVHSQLVFQF